MKIIANTFIAGRSFWLACTVSLTGGQGQKFLLLKIAGVILFGAFANQAKADNFIYNFGVTSANAAPSTDTFANASGGFVMQGNNNGTTTLLTTTSPSSAYTGASGNYNAGAAARTGTLVTGANGSAYFQLTLTPDSGYSITLTDITFGSRSTSTGPANFALYGSTDGTNFSALSAGTLTTTAAYTLIDSPNFSLTSTTSITLRLYGYGGTGSASANTANWRIDDLTVIGTTAVTGGGGGGPQNLTFDPSNNVSRLFNSNTANTNFDNATSIPTAFTNGDTVNFTDTGVGVVTVDASFGALLPAAINISNATGTYTFTGDSIGGAGVLTKTGAGTLDLTSQTSGNGYTGGTVLNGGVVIVSNDNQLGGAAGALTFSGGTLRTSTAGITSARNVTVNAGGAIFDSNGFNSSLSGTVGGTGTFSKIGAGNLSLSGTVNGITLGIGAGGSVTFAQASGTQNIIASATTGTFVGDLIVATPIRLNINGGSVTGGGSIQVQTTGTSLANTGTVTTTIGNNIVLNSLNAVGAFVANLGPVSTSTVTIDGIISGSSDLNIAGGGPINPVAGGSGTITFNQQNTYTGATTINMTGTATAKLGIDNALPTATALSFGTNTGATGSILDLNGHAQTVASLSTGAVGTPSNYRITNNGAVDSTFTVNGSTSPAGFAGTIADGTTNKVLLVKGGIGVLTLSGINTFTGGTQVNGGALVVNGGVAGTSSGAGAGPVIVNNSGTLLGGAGAIGGAVTVGGGATLSPGATAGAAGDTSTAVLSTGALTLQATATYSVNLNGTTVGTGYDQVGVTGTVSLDGSVLSLALRAGFTPDGSEKFFIINNDLADPVTGTFASVSGLPSGFSVIYDADFGSGALSGGNDVAIAAVPEPATVLGGLLMLGALGWSQRRRIGGWMSSSQTRRVGTLA